MLTNWEFEKKYFLHKDMVYRIAFTYMKNVQESEDVLQEVFLKLYMRESSFESEEHEKRWLIKVTTNLCKDKLGLFWNKRRCSFEGLEQLVDKDEERNVIQDIVSLPEKYRIAIYLHYVEGYSCKEIAEILGKSESAVKMRLKRGKEMLKNERR